MVQGDVGVLFNGVSSVQGCLGCATMVRVVMQVPFAMVVEDRGYAAIRVRWWTDCWWCSTVLGCWGCEIPGGFLCQGFGGVGRS